MLSEMQITETLERHEPKLDDPRHPGTLRLMKDVHRQSKTLREIAIEASNEAEAQGIGSAEIRVASLGLQAAVRVMDGECRAATCYGMRIDRAKVLAALKLHLDRCEEL